jgi:hypothetical protein
MNCGCIKHLGCFLPNEPIKFGILAPYTGNFEFEIFSQNGFSVLLVAGTFGSELTLPFTFNENSNTIIKIKIDSGFAANGFYYITSSDGACSFEVTGIVPSC